MSPQLVGAFVMRYRLTCVRATAVERQYAHGAAIRLRRIVGMTWVDGEMSDVSLNNAAEYVYRLVGAIFDLTKAPFIAYFAYKHNRLLTPDPAIMFPVRLSGTADVIICAVREREERTKGMRTRSRRTMMSQPIPSQELAATRVVMQLKTHIDRDYATYWCQSFAELFAGDTKTAQSIVAVPTKLQDSWTSLWLIVTSDRQRQLHHACFTSEGAGHAALQAFLTNGVTQRSMRRIKLRDFEEEA